MSVKNQYEKMIKCLVNNKYHNIHLYAQFGLWSEFRQIRKAVEEGKAQVVDSGFYKELYSWEKDNKPNILVESTYPECVDIEIDLEKGEAKITFWKGNMFDSRREGRYCWWVVKIKLLSFDFIKAKIKKSMLNLVKDKRDEELRLAEEKRLQEIHDQLLSEV